MTDRAPKDWDSLYRPENSPVYLSLPVTLAASAGTVHYRLGVADWPKMVAVRFHALPQAALALSPTAFHTFRPFISQVVNGVESIRYLGTARATSGLGLAVGVPFRLTEEQRLNERVADGAVIGVSVVTTGTPTATAVTLQASLFVKDS